MDSGQKDVVFQVDEHYYICVIRTMDLYGSATKIQKNAATGKEKSYSASYCPLY